MEKSLSIQNILSNKNSYNLAIPFIETQQMNPFYKVTVSQLYIDTNDTSMFFKIGSKSMGNNKFEDLYTLANPFLQRLASEAGIQFAQNSGDVVKIDENTWKANAFGAIRLPDGVVRTSNNFKVIDLLTEERKYRISYEEKSVSGILDYRAAKDASEKYAGEWVDTGEKNNNGYPIRLYKIAEPDRSKYIEKSLLDSMAQLRSSAPQKAATGAILRVIRNLTGLKGTYTMNELKKPFVVARMSFSPDYSDPTVKQIMLQQCIHSVGNLFGNVSNISQTDSISTNYDRKDEIPILAEPVKQTRKEPEKEITSVSPRVQQSGYQMTEEDRSQDFCCDKCGKVIPEKVWNYSVEKLDRPLCYQCQKIVRSESK